jgi:hypothetical protein
MAQDPEREDELTGDFDPSSNLDLVTLFSSSAIDAELEANNIHGILQANDIGSVIVGNTVLPMLEFQVQVPRAQFHEAERLLEEARAAGPDAAAEAESATE